MLTGAHFYACATCGVQFTFVALDNLMRVKQLPPLIVTSELEKHKWAEAKLKYILEKAKRAKNS